MSRNKPVLDESLSDTLSLKLLVVKIFGSSLRGIYFYMKQAEDD